MPEVVVLILARSNATRDHLASQLSTAIYGCRFLTASSHDTALSMIKRETPHLVIIEQKLATISGLPLTELVRAISPITEVVIVPAPESAAAAA